MRTKRHTPTAAAPSAAREMWREKLRVLLRGHGITQRDLARQLGVSYGLPAKWLNGESRMSLDSAQRVAAILQISVDELLANRPLPAGVVQTLFGGTLTTPPVVDSPRAGMDVSPVATGEAAAADETATREGTSVIELRRRLAALVEAIPDEALYDANLAVVSLIQRAYGTRSQAVNGVPPPLKFR